MHSTVRYDCLFAFRRLISGVLLVRRVGQPFNENQSRRHKPLSQVCHGFVAVQSLVAKIESALWSQLSPKISAQFDGQFFVDCRQWFQKFFVVLPRHVLWSVQETCAILSTNQVTNLEPSAPGHSYFPALQAVCLRWLWSLTGYLWHFHLFWLLCFHFDITQLYYYFSNCYQLSVQKPKQKLSQLTTNQNKCYHHYCPVRTESLRRGKTRVIKVGSVFVLHLTGWNDGASFLVQSKSKVNKTDATQDHFRL